MYAQWAWCLLLSYYIHVIYMYLFFSLKHVTIVNHLLTYLVIFTNCAHRLNISQGEFEYWN